MRGDTYAWPPSDSSAPGSQSEPWASKPASAQDATVTSSYNARYEVNYGRGPSWATEEPAIAQMQQQTEKHEQNIAESQLRMLRVAANTHALGADTLGKLHEQGDQLRHVQKEQERIDDNLATADKLINSLESWRGAAKNALVNWWNSSSSQTESTNAGDAVSTPRAAAPPAARATVANPFCVAAGSRSACSNAAATSGSDDAMAQISSLVDGLHAQALAMNDSIRDQSTMLDGSLQTAERHQDKLDVNNRRARKLLGR